MDVFTLAGLAALAGKLTSWLKMLRAQQFGDALTQAVAWAIGVGVAFLARSADVVAMIEPVPGHPLGGFDDASTALFGLALASGFSFAYDVKRALDASDSAAEPPLAPALDNPSHDVSGQSVIAIIVAVLLIVLALRLLGVL